MSTNTDAALGFNAYVYDRYATTGNANHNSSKFIDTGSMALLTGRAIGGAVAARTRRSHGSNFPSTQAFEMDFRYTLLIGSGEAARVCPTSRWCRSLITGCGWSACTRPRGTG